MKLLTAPRVCHVLADSIIVDGFDGKEVTAKEGEDLQLLNDS